MHFIKRWSSSMQCDSGPTKLYFDLWFFNCKKKYSKCGINVYDRNERGNKNNNLPKISKNVSEIFSRSRIVTVKICDYSSVFSDFSACFALSNCTPWFDVFRNFHSCSVCRTIIPAWWRLYVMPWRDDVTMSCHDPVTHGVLYVCGTSQIPAALMITIFLFLYSC